MIIPRYWAEARLQNKLPNRQITVRHWGWSDTSQEEAQALAEQRAQETMNRIVAGEDLRRREPKETYGTEDGVPIREEVVSRHGNTIITRNSYGSLCLNTPNVLFADVDAEWRGALRINPAGCLLIFVAGLVAGLTWHSVVAALAIMIGGPLLWSVSNRRTNQSRRPQGEEIAKQQSMEIIRCFAAKNPDWHIRVYQTPAGFRLLAMHDVFDPKDEATTSVLRALDSDERFIRLCALQDCFRARVSPKYWRIGYRPKEGLPKSKWPFPAEHLPIRQRWVNGYDARAAGFASCRFLEKLGSDVVHPEAEAVRALHDQLCQSATSFPLA